MTAVATDPVVQAEIVSIPLALIDRDPGQPRFAENVDTDLAPSFKAHGWFESKPLEIRPHPEDPDRYQLVDGERRYAGAKAAGLKDALCILTFDVDGISEADRLARQIMDNSGKPLTPVEQALAFKRIIDDRRSAANGKGDKKYGPVQLARDLGLPKSTVQDRLAVTELLPFWLKLIVKGPLQLSHAPVLYRYRQVPEKYQLRAYEKMQDEWRWPGGRRVRAKIATESTIYVEDFEDMVHSNMRPFIRPLSDVPGYKGPTAKIEDTKAWPRRVVTMAMDATLWEPIWRKRIADKKKRNKGKAPAKDSWKAKYEKQREEQDRRYAAERRRQAQYAKAAPALAKAFAEKIAAAPVKDLQTFVLANLKDGRRSKKVGAFVALGATPEQFVRHLAMLAIDEQLHQSWQVERKVPALGKRFKVDVAAIVKPDALEKEEQQPDPATTDPGEAGDGRMVVDAADEDEDDG